MHPEGVSPRSRGAHTALWRNAPLYPGVCIMGRRQGRRNSRPAPSPAIRLEQVRAEPHLQGHPGPHYGENARQLFHEADVLFRRGGIPGMWRGFLFALLTLYDKYFSGVKAHNNPLLLLAVFLFLLGVQFILMGLVAELVIRTYFESQGKTPYIVRQIRNLSGTNRSQLGRRASPPDSEDSIVFRAIWI